MKKKEEGSFWEIALGIFVILMILGAIGTAFEFVSDKWNDRSSKKSYCAKHYTVLNAKSDFAAKQAYKACMR
tara:strand:+ start:106 stop:321 length:216 start_codon:yes stop_codon:yes gene_type:complete